MIVNEAVSRLENEMKSKFEALKFDVSQVISDYSSEISATKNDQRDFANKLKKDIEYVRN